MLRWVELAKLNVTSKYERQPDIYFNTDKLQPILELVVAALVRQLNARAGG